MESSTVDSGEEGLSVAPVVGVIKSVDSSMVEEPENPSEISVSCAMSKEGAAAVCSGSIEVTAAATWSHIQAPGIWEVSMLMETALAYLLILTELDVPDS